MFTFDDARLEYAINTSVFIQTKLIEETQIFDEWDYRDNFALTLRIGIQLIAIKGWFNDRKKKIQR